jgi:hypothetical protein
VTADVVELGARRPIVATPAVEELRYWQCACDCVTFSLRADGRIECSSCGKLVDCIAGAWQLPRPSDGGDPKRIATRSTIDDLGDPNLAVKVMLRRAAARDLAYLIAVASDGRVLQWGSSCNVEQDRWLARKLREAWRGARSMGRRASR